MAEEEKKKKKGKYVIPSNMMKLITLATLLISDADVLFTCTSIYAYLINVVEVPCAGVVPTGNGSSATAVDEICTEPAPLVIMVILVGLFTMVYIGGCLIAAKESGLFVFRFREKVRLNEIAGLDLEEMDLFFSGKPVKVAEQKTLEAHEQEFHDKAEGKASRPNRAAREGVLCLRISARW